MGSAIARNLLRAGLSVTVWNRTREKAEGLARDGATVASTPAAAAASSDIVLTMLADWDAVESTCERVFGAIGQKTARVGEEPGRASAFKLVLNTWLIGLVESLAETVALARALGFEPELFLETISGGSVDSPYAQIKGKAMAQKEFPPSFPLRLARKDASLVAQEAERRELDLPAIRAALRQLERAQEFGLGDQDLAAVYQAAGPGVERPA